MTDGPATGTTSVMATRIEKEHIVDAPREAVSAAMRNRELIVESEKLRDALRVDVRETQKDDARHAYEIDTENYARGVTGVDRSKTETSTTSVSWDLGAQTRSWTWFNRTHGDKVRVKGFDSLIADGERTRIRFTADIDVSIPMVGKVVEKKVAAGFEEAWPKYVQLVGKYAKQ